MKYRVRYEGLHCSGVFHAPQIGLPRERIQPVVKIKRPVFNDRDLVELTKLLVEDEKKVQS